MYEKKKKTERGASDIFGILDEDVRKNDTN